MSEQAEKKEITLPEVSKAIEIVGVLLNQITIPANRAQEFALLTSTLGELKSFVDGKINENAPEVAEEVVNTPES
jgi:hypothetical protein